MPRGVPAFRPVLALSNTDNATNNVNVGAGAAFSNLSQMTFFTLVLTTSVANAIRNIAGKTVSSAGWEIFKRGVDGTQLRFARNRTGGQINIDATSGQLVANEWAFWAGSYDDNAAGNCRIYKGTLALPMADVTSGSPTIGGTAPGSDTAALRLLASATPGSGWPGSMAVFVLFARVLSLAELRLLQASIGDTPAPAVMQGCVGLWYPNADGTHVVLDRSGYQNTGTVTGLTLTQAVPLAARHPWQMLRPRGRVPDAAAADFAAYYQQYYRSLLAA